MYHAVVMIKTEKPILIAASMSTTLIFASSRIFELALKHILTAQKDGSPEVRSEQATFFRGLTHRCACYSLAKLDQSSRQ